MNYERDIETLNEVKCISQGDAWIKEHLDYRFVDIIRGVKWFSIR